MEVKGRKIGFLGYCDSPTYPNQNWTELRIKYDVGPAVYSDNIAARDINKLKVTKLIIFQDYFFLRRNVFKDDTKIGHTSVQVKKYALSR